MGKLEQFIQREKEHYGDIFAELTYAKSELEPFLDPKVLKARRYVSRLPILDKYMEYLESTKTEMARQGMFGMFKDNHYIGLLEDFKRDNTEAIEQLSQCAKCECAKCPKECEFSSCFGCKDGSRVNQCDHESQNFVVYDYRVIPLQNNETGELDDFIVLATMENLKRNQRYIFLKNIATDEKLVLYYDPGINDDSYGEIADEEEFDEVVSAYQSMELL